MTENMSSATKGIQACRKGLIQNWFQSSKDFFSFFLFFPFFFFFKPVPVNLGSGPEGT